MKKRLAMVAVFALSSTACDAITDVGKPFAATLQIDKTTVQVDETVTFVVKATGTFLYGMELTYGDGTEAEERFTDGAQSTEQTFLHAYSAPGAYEVSALVVEASGASRIARGTVNVTAAAAPQTAPQ